ncbi:MAG: hypothetical protein OXC68_10180 [Aestuariivita sp.]|nr:hypothetical protein [Aestuariivita sp.]
MAILDDSIEPLLELQTNVVSLQSDILDVKSDIVDLKSDVSDIKSNIATILYSYGSAKRYDANCGTEKLAGSGLNLVLKSNLTNPPLETDLFNLEKACL